MNGKATDIGKAAKNGEAPENENTVDNAVIIADENSIASNITKEEDTRKNEETKEKENTKKGKDNMKRDDSATKEEAVTTNEELAANGNVTTIEEKTTKVESSTNEEALVSGETIANIETTVEKKDEKVVIVNAKDTKDTNVKIEEENSIETIQAEEDNKNTKEVNVVKDTKHTEVVFGAEIDVVKENDVSKKAEAIKEPHVTIDAKEVVTKTDEIPMEDTDIKDTKDTNATKNQDFSTIIKTIDNEDTISMDVAATTDMEADEETEITFKSNQDIKDVDVPEKTEEKAEEKALKEDDVSIQSDGSNEKNVTGENALSDKKMESEVAEDSKDTTEAEVTKQDEVTKTVDAEIIKNSEGTDITKDAELNTKAENVKDSEVAMEGQITMKTEVTSEAETSKETDVTDDAKVVKEDDIAKDDINMEAKAIKREDELSKNTEDKMVPLMKLLKTKVMEMNPQLKKRKRIKDLFGADTDSIIEMLEYYAHVEQVLSSVYVQLLFFIKQRNQDEDKGFIKIIIQKMKKKGKRMKELQLS